MTGGPIDHQSESRQHVPGDDGGTSAEGRGPLHPYGGIEPRFTPEELADALDGHRPTPQQSAVISAPLTPRLVVAGAGSGKTATMVDRVVWLVANGIVRADQVLGVTFTRKAAGELRDRVRGRLSVLRAKGLLEAGQPQDPPVPLAAREPHDAHVFQDRTTEEAPGLSPDPTVLTYHSYASTLVRTYGLRIGVEPETVLLGQAQAWQLASRVVESWDGEVSADLKASSLTQQVLGLASGAAEHLRSPEEIEGFIGSFVPQLLEVPPRGRTRSPGDDVKTAVSKMARTRLLAQLVERFRALKEHTETMDFGDLLERAARIAREDSAARELERERFKVVLLDEFQDTSHAQMVLFASLFGAGHSVMAVGDPQQSIYGFRGASAGQLFGFGRWFPAPDGAVSEPAFLTTAWRNDTSILDAANVIARPLRTPPPWSAGTAEGLQEVPELDARPGAGPGRVTVSRYLTDDDESRAIARAIHETREGLVPGEAAPTAAVLCRRRSQFEPVRRELAARGIAYEVVGLGGLLEVPEVADVVATLQVLTDPGRSDALARLLTGARWRIGARDLVALADWAGHLERRRSQAAEMGLSVEDIDAQPATGEDDVVVEPDQAEMASLIEALETLPRPGWTSSAGRSLSETARERMQHLAGELHGLRSWLSEDLATVLTVVERTLGVDIEVSARTRAAAAEGRRNLDALMDVAVSYTSATGSEDVRAFLAWLKVAASEENPDTAVPDPDPAAVQILTVHASKGLEWDQVFVPGMNAGVFPADRGSAWTKDAAAVPWPLRGDRDFLPQWHPDPSDAVALKESMQLFLEDCAQHTQDEERRLAYVAFTRARTLLALSSTVFTGGGVKQRQQSVFLEELEELTRPGPAGVSVVERGAWTEAEADQQNPAQSRTLEAAWPYDPLEGPEITEIIATPQDGAVQAQGLPGQDPPGQDPSDALERRITHPPVRAGRRKEVLRVAEAVRDGGFPEYRGLTDRELLDLPVVRDWAEEARVLMAAHEAEPDEQVLPMPSHISASTVVALGQDPQAVAAQMRRPMPRRPAVAARAGTTFHAWVEQYFGSNAIFDIDELPGGSDDFVDEGYDLPALARTFRESEWGRRQPWAVEYPVETPLGGLTVRGRIDAVFKEPDGHWELVDWKSGRVPPEQELTQRAAQLAVYRLAWARLMGVSVDQVSAAFYYVASDRTVRPHDLADEARLEAIVTRAMG